MNKTNIFQEPEEITDKLSYFGIKKEELLAVALEAASQRNNATPLQPINAPGTLSYIFGVEALRLAFTQKDGWKADRTGGIESVFNPELNIKILFQNVDIACGKNTPQAISDKGAGVKKLLEMNTTGYLFDYMQKEDDSEANRNIWFFCVSSNNEEVRAELSLPHSIKNKQFSYFNERIFILSDNDWTPTLHNDQDDFDDTDDYDISVTRK